MLKNNLKLLARLRTGKHTSDDIKQIWGSLTTELQKYQFLITTIVNYNSANNIIKMINDIETNPDMKEVVDDLITRKADVEGGDRICWYSADYDYHREGDKPAVIYDTGTKAWYNNGTKHRDNDQPATIKANGDKFWWVNGKRHRDDDKPAIEYADGRKEYWKNGATYDPNR